MAFNELLNVLAAEADLLKKIVFHLQSHYSAYQKNCYFLKLDKVAEKNSQIVWIKTFSDMYALGDFYYDTEFQRSCVLVKFEDGRYELLFQGFQIGDRFKVWTDKIEGNRPIEITWNREERQL